jgi:hypothetical protein
MDLRRGIGVSTLYQGRELVTGAPSKNPEIVNLSIFRISTPNLVSKVLY